jgi:hypothetical protein
MCQGNVTSIAPNSDLDQRGGLVDMKFINLGGGTNYPGGISYHFRQGLVRCGTLNIGDNGLFMQEDGSCIITNTLDLHGFYFNVPRGPLITHADYHLAGGRLSTPSISIGEFGTFTQSGGSNLVAGDLTVSIGNYFLENGDLETANTAVGLPARLAQNRGAHHVDGVLSITGNYDLEGGGLFVNGLYLRGSLTLNSYYAPAQFFNSGLADFGGVLHVNMDGNFGQMRLATNALLDLSGGSARVHFQNSSGIAWLPAMSLVISNWSASGTARVYFGTDASGLTASQLTQLQFVNPGGMSPGYYAAKIDADGEIVPAQSSGPSLTAQRSENGLVLSWPSGYTLQSASNVGGPYQDVSGATSPYSAPLGKQQEFFRLRQ